MTVEVDRSFDVDATREEVWELLADEENRARVISVVEDYEVVDPQRHEVTWHIRLPIPLIKSTIAVRTWDVERNPPGFVKFVGRSKVMNVTGEHEITSLDSGCRVRNRFVVDGKVPGVEKFFERNFDSEIENIKRAVSERVGAVEEA